MSYGCNTGEAKTENGVRQNEMESTHTNPANLRSAKTAVEQIFACNLCCASAVRLSRSGKYG